MKGKGNTGIQEKRECVEVLRKLVAEADAAVNDEKF